MSQRSYSNDRYRKDAKIGSTRKSAAKAKPVRKQGEVTSAKTSAKPAEKAKTRERITLPTSPKLKKWQGIWYALLGTGMVLVLVGSFVPQLRADRAVQTVLLLFVSLLAGTALFIDFKVIRTERNALVEAATKKKSTKHDGTKTGASGKGDS